MKLIYERANGQRKDGTPIKKGDQVMLNDEVKDFRGEQHIVVGITEPEHEGSTGRVYVRPYDGEWTAGFYPGVFDMKWRMK